MDTPFLHKGKKVNLEHRLFVTFACCVRWIDSDDFGASFCMFCLNYCCINCPVVYCWVLLLSSAWLGQLDFEVHFRQSYFFPQARVLLESKNFVLLGVCLSEKSQCYVGLGNFGWGLYHGLWLLLLPTSPVFFFYSRLAFNPRYRLLPCVVSLTEFGACNFFSCSVCGVSRRIQQIW